MKKTSGTTEGTVTNRSSMTKNPDGSVTVHRESTVTLPGNKGIPNAKADSYASGIAQQKRTPAPDPMSESAYSKDLRGTNYQQPSPGVSESSEAGNTAGAFDAGANGNFNSGPAAVARYKRMAREIGGDTRDGTGADRIQLEHDSEFIHGRPLLDGKR
jgi:hypothetical protein